MSEQVDAVSVSVTGGLRRLRDPQLWGNSAAFVGLVALIIIFQTINSVFLSPGNISVMLQSAAILVILTVGQTFVIASAGIDLSIASSMTFAAVVFGQCYLYGLNLVVCCIFAVLAGAAVGAANGLLVSRGKITDFIVTLGSLSAASGAALILADGKSVTIIEPALLHLATGSIGVVGYLFIIALVIAVLAHITLFHTRFGTHVLATGGSKEAAAATGVKTWRIKTAVYVIAGAMAGIGSILLVARLGAANPAANLRFLLNSVAAVVLGGVSLFGGRATILGPFIGALLLTVLVNGLTLVGVSQFYQPLAIGIVVVLAAFLTRFQQ